MGEVPCCGSRSRTRAAAPRLPTSATGARARCPATRSRGAAASRSRPCRPRRLSASLHAVPGRTRASRSLRASPDARKEVDGKAPTTMDKWGSRSSSGRHTPARSLFCSTGSCAALDRDPWLIVPNRVDVDRVERELAGRGGALLAGTIGTFDTLFAVPRRHRPAVRSARRGGAHDRASPHRQHDATRDARAVVAIRRLHGRSCRNSGRDRGGPARARTISTLTWRCSQRHIGPSSRGSSVRSGNGSTPGSGAAHDRPRLVGGGAGVRLRVRGPDRRRMAPDRSARRPGRGAHLPPVRAGSGGIRIARTHRRGSRRARRGDRRARARIGAVSRDRSRAPRTPSLRRRGPICRARQLDSLPRRSRPARDARARRRDDPRSRPRRNRARRDRGRLSLRRPLACVDRDGIRLARRPDRDREPAKARRRPRSARRSSRSFASPGETAPAASSTPSCGRRMPASRARMSTSSRAGCEGAPCSGATARWRRRRSSATAAPFPCWISLHPRSSRCAPLGPWLWRCFATPTALVRRLRPRRRSATSGRQRRSRGCSTSWSASRAAACRSPPTMSSLLSIARPCAATRRANRAALRFSIWDVPARGASRPCS